MGRIIAKNPQDLLNPLREPDISGLTPTITGVAPNNLASQTPVPGDVIQLDGTTFSMSFDYTVSGFAGTQANPIWILGNGSTYDGKKLELLNHEWVYFADFNCINSTNAGVLIEDCENCIFKNFTVDNTGNDGVSIRGTTTRPNNRLAFFDFTVTNWAVSDGFSVHASGSEEDNGANFVIRNLTCQNPVDQAENGLDITSGSNFYVWGYRGTDANAHVAHGVENVYIYDFVHNFDGTSTRDQSLEFKNTEGDIWVAETSGNGEIDLGVQSSPRSNETPNSTLGLYITYELKVFNNGLSGGIDNNTSGSGTIVTIMDYNELGFLQFSGFSRWPMAI